MTEEISATEYTPTTGDVCAMYTWAIIEHGSDQESEASEAFDRWLAAHDAELERQCTAWVKSATEAKDAERAMRAERDALRAQLDGMTTALSRIVEVANFSAIEGSDGFVWRYDMPPGPIHTAIKVLSEAGHPVESVGRVRLNPEVRADLIEFARTRIQMVWDDAGEVDATTLASNVVAAQEFLWLSLHFPVEVAD